MLPYQNKDLPVCERVSDLLGRMTLDEKFDQLRSHWDLKKLCERLKNGEKLPPYGNLFTRYDFSEEELDTVQRYFVEETRLGIPILPAFEGIRGLLHKEGTVYPQCAGLGGSFNPALVEQMAQYIGTEARAVGIRHLYAPNIDVYHEPRFGRTMEAYGEDPYLLGEMGAAYVKGLQQNDVAATAKHYIAYGMPEAGINLAPAHVGEREVREVMLEPFKKCIDAGVLSVMPSYNEVDGEPVHASKKWLRDVLRGELGFDGVNINDYGAIEMLHTFQEIAETAYDAGKLALEAGVDIEALDPYGFCDELREGIRNGDVDEALLDEAVARILTLKFKVGLFENPYALLHTPENYHTPEAVALSREMDEQSILLFENDGILPLNENSCGTVAVIGNNAKYSFLGDYISLTPACVSFYDGMVNRLGEDRVRYAMGCNPATRNDSLIAEAVDAAKQSDVVFLVLGDNCPSGFGGVAGEEGVRKFETTCGEGYDVNSLDMFPSQRRLFDAIVALGKPTVLVMYAGRPYAIKEQAEQCNAFMYSFGGGEQSGNAFANLIFGDRSPSAKTAVSFPLSTGHIPCHYNHKPSAGGYYKRHGSPEQTGRDYVLSTPGAWYPFGYGLSYTTVEYSDLAVTVNGKHDVCISVTVENTGNYDIDETVLLFLRAFYTRTTPFVKRLRRFEKVHLAKGERKTVQFTLNKEDFTYIDVDYSTAYSDGKHRVTVGDLSCDFSF